MWWMYEKHDRQKMEFEDFLLVLVVGIFGLAVVVGLVLGA